jgi:hypothetical protein
MKGRYELGVTLTAANAKINQVDLQSKIFTAFKKSSYLLCYLESKTVWKQQNKQKNSS